MVEVKFCAMTREEDVREAVRLGACYVGVIMTESRRRVTPQRAAQLRSAVDGTGVRTVGVFGDEKVDDIIIAASLAGVDIIQLHGRSTGGANDNQHSAVVARLRAELGAEVWRVIRVGPQGLGEPGRSASDSADGILLDTLVAGGALGGSGVSFDWDRAVGEAQALRAGRRLIVAGGLKPENVRVAIDRLAPDVVDVSSGVESEPGIKDHQRMAAFMASVLTPTPAANR